MIAPASSICSVSRISETPVRLAGSDAHPGPAETPHQLGSGVGLAGVHAGPGDVDDRHPAAQLVAARHGALADVGGATDAIG